MARNSKIEWCEHTWNLAWGCVHCGPGCDHCYAEALAPRFGFPGLWGQDSPRRVFGEKHWAEPLKWDRLARQAGRKETVFCSSMCDIFEAHPTIDAEREKLWPLIRQTEDLYWLCLTKRAARIRRNLPADWGTGWSNVWLGATVEDRKHGFPRIDQLRDVPASIRFLSIEPLLEDLDEIDLDGIHWVIVGGESGPKSRPMQADWVRSIRDQCAAAGVLFFFKQWGGVKKAEAGRELDGEFHNARPFRAADIESECPITVGAQAGVWCEVTTAFLVDNPEFQHLLVQAPRGQPTQDGPIATEDE